MRKIPQHKLSLVLYNIIDNEIKPWDRVLSSNVVFSLKGHQHRLPLSTHSCSSILEQGIPKQTREFLVTSLTYLLVFLWWRQHMWLHLSCSSPYIDHALLCTLLSYQLSHPNLILLLLPLFLNYLYISFSFPPLQLLIFIYCYIFWWTFI